MICPGCKEELIELEWRERTYCAKCLNREGKIEWALRTADRIKADEKIEGDYILDGDVVALAAEVRRLRELEAQTVKMAVYAQQLEAKVAEANGALTVLGRDLAGFVALRGRLRALPDNWRALASTVNDPTSPSIYVDCAEDLERVLNDD